MNRALINATSGITQKPLRYVMYVRKSSEDAERRELRENFKYEAELNTKNTLALGIKMSKV